MAVVAVLLGTVVAANLAEDPGATEDPRASFTFETDNASVLVTQYGGDNLDPASVYVESGTRGRLGNFDGSAGMACTRNVTELRSGRTCRVPDARYDQLYIVWQGPQSRTHILARRSPDPTPTATPTPVPTTTPTPVTASETEIETATPGSPTTGTRTATPPTETTKGPATEPPGGTTPVGTEQPAGTAPPGNETAQPAATSTPAAETESG
jgi:hypothetical protein